MAGVTLSVNVNILSFLFLRKNKSYLYLVIITMPIMGYIMQYKNTYYVYDAFPIIVAL